MYIEFWGSIDLRGFSVVSISRNGVLHILETIHFNFYLLDHFFAFVTRLRELIQTILNFGCLMAVGGE
ncbi:MAG: hypothetical protein AAF355_10565 [Myxococcota bacterium]